MSNRIKGFDYETHAPVALAPTGGQERIATAIKAGGRLTSKILLSAASVAVSAATCASNTVGMSPTSHSPQIMFYVSQTLWSPGRTFRVYGLRIDEVRAKPTSAQSGMAGSFRRSELLDLQIAPHSDIRIEFGRRLTWDFTHEAFGPQSSATSLAIGFTIHSIRSPDPLRPQRWDLRAPGLSLMAGRLVPTSQAGGVRVTVAAAVVTLRLKPLSDGPVNSITDRKCIDDQTGDERPMDLCSGSKP